MQGHTMLFGNSLGMVPEEVVVLAVVRQRTHNGDVFNRLVRGNALERMTGGPSESLAGVKNTHHVPGAIERRPTIQLGPAMDNPLQASNRTHSGGAG